MSESLTVQAAWSAVMKDVQSIRKDEKNRSQGFNFRGIDTVMSAVGPKLREHGVSVIPTPLEIQVREYETSKGTAMNNVVVTMRYEVRGPAGDSFIGGAFGEASDAGDKAVSKAQSVAYRVFLLQSLTIPTDDPEPDAESHERSASSQPEPQGEAVIALSKAAVAKGLSVPQKQEFRAALGAKGLPQSPKDMSEDEARMALVVLNETFPA